MEAKIYIHLITTAVLNDAHMDYVSGVCVCAAHDKDVTPDQMTLICEIVRTSMMQEKE